MVWQNGKWKVNINEDETTSHGTITLHDTETGQEETVQQLQCNQSETVLGVNIRPDGSMADIVKRMREKVEICAARLRSTHFKAEDNWYCINATIMKAWSIP